MNARAERWHQVSELFDRVADLIPEERQRILDDECANDPDLRAEVERLLRADDLSGNPLDHDIAAQASALLLEGDPHEHEGQCFGPYRIVKLLGQGGMGRVYLAQREGEDFAQTVALKLIGGHGSFDAALARRRFLDERRMLARLQHPHIARLLDGGVGAEAQPWFAMEYVDGAPLTEWCDTHQLGIPARLEMFAKVCDAVDHAHRFLIVHRDIKPGNVLVDEHGEPKVLDFGIAKLLDEGEHARTGSTILMTPDYAAPEQIRGGQISTATDVYALGAVLFEVLTGRKPFADPLVSREPPLASKAATAIGSDTGPRAAARCSTPQTLRKALKGDIDRILRTALDPDPARRYGSAAVLAQDLRAVVAGEAISLRSDRTYQIGIFLRRHRLGVAAASIAVLGLIGTTGWALWQTRHALHQTEIAKQEALASESVSELLASAFNAADPNMRKSLAEPTAKDVLDASAARVSGELKDTPALLARVRMLLGRAYQNLGYADKAAGLLETAIAGFLSKEVDRPDQAVKALSTLAEVEMERERRDHAIVTARQALTLLQRIDATPEDQIEVSKKLGMTLIGAARYEEAEQTMLSAQRLTLQVYGDPSPELASSFHNLAELASNAGEVRKAERLFRTSVAMKTRLKANPESFYTSRSLLANALRRQGRFSEAEALLLHNLKLVSSLYPDDSENRSKLEQRLGAVYREKGDLLRAQSRYQNAIALETRATGARSPEIAMLMEYLAEVLEMRGNPDEAERIYRMAHEVLSQAPSVRERTKLRAAAKYGVFLVRNDKEGLARDRLESVLARWIAHYGPTGRYSPWDLADARFLDAEYRLATGRLESVEAALPAFDPDAEQPLQQARRHYFLARMHTLRGNRQAAIAEIEQAVQGVEGIAGRESALAALWRLEYADLLMSAGKKAQAVQQLDLAEPTLRKQMLPTGRSISRLKELRRTTT